MALLELAKVNKYYRIGSEKLHIISDLDFKLDAAQSATICGQSGCGKSTLLNLIGGLDNLSSGEITSADYRLGVLSEKKLTTYRQTVVGLVFQFHYLLKDLNSLENVILPGRIVGTNTKKLKALGRQLLKEVGLADRLEHYPSMLSGGERQRVAVVRALINQPKLLLADEPTGNLDEENSKLVEDLLFSLVEKHDTALLLVTHDKRLAQRGQMQLNMHDGFLD